MRIEANHHLWRYSRYVFVLTEDVAPIVRRDLLPRELEREMALCEFAQRSNVPCELFGLLTEADWQQWTDEDIRPYLDICLHALGPERCMARAGLPVYLARVLYKACWQVRKRWSRELSTIKHQNIRDEAATSFHGLPELSQEGHQ